MNCQCTKQTYWGPYDWIIMLRPDRTLGPGSSEESSTEVLGRDGGIISRVSSRGDGSETRRRQGIFWMLTIPHHEFTPYLPTSCAWIKGQLEEGQEGYLHWQVIVAFHSKKSLAQVVSCFGRFHAELTKSDSASDYVWKEDTCVSPSTRFNLV